MSAAPKVVVVMPAYNAGRTLRMTYEELPKDTVNLVILVDDGSTDATLDVARQLGLSSLRPRPQLRLRRQPEDVLHGGAARRRRHRGDGASRLPVRSDAGAADHRAHPARATRTWCSARGSRAARRWRRGCRGGSSSPTASSPGSRTVAFGLHLSEYHTGYRAFRREVLETVNFRANSDGFVFDQEIIAQAVAAGFRIAEIAVPARYFPEASSASFVASSIYGLRILAVLFWFG